jgi:anaerobic selenocysteine-containing dehydrogenase
VFSFLSREPVHDPLVAPTPTADTTVKTTTCYMCACRCGIRVHLRDRKRNERSPGEGSPGDRNVS